ncbi:MAG: DUF305 domain-containing protein [Acidobacteria bacterium]|nr:DUF305 domain-containing protein [Acidobacteriota bacterium]
MILRNRAFLAVVVASLLVFGCSTHSENDGHDHSGHDHGDQGHAANTDHAGMDHSTMASSPGAADAPRDLQFIDTMIVHHQGALDMAKLAEVRASRDELKKFGAAIIADQDREITQMKRWRGEWYKDAKPAINMDFPGMKDGMAQMDMKRLGELNGAEFDREFIRQMIVHHSGAVVMSRSLLDKAAEIKLKPELKKLAEAIVTAQNGEIEQMNKWLSEWK